jgi:uncharacterized protein
MPGGASKLRDVRKLSDARAILDLDIPLAELPGLPVELILSGGPLRAEVQFGREQGFMVAEVAMSGELMLACQRCLGPIRWPVDVRSPVLLVESEADAEGAPPERETYLATEGRLSVAGLAAEELLLALPIVPLHADGGECEEVVAAKAVEPVAEQVTARPFADLRALLEQGAKRKD